MSTRKDLTGNVYGDFLVISHEGVENTHATWNTVCTKCGHERVITGNNLKSGYSKHCQVCNSQRSKHSIEEIAHIINDYIDFKPVWMIEEKHSVRYATIYKILKDHNIPTTRKRR